MVYSYEPNWVDNVVGSFMSLRNPRIVVLSLIHDTMGSQHSDRSWSVTWEDFWRLFILCKGDITHRVTSHYKHEYNSHMTVLTLEIHQSFSFSEKVIHNMKYIKVYLSSSFITQFSLDLYHAFNCCLYQTALWVWTAVETARDTCPLSLDAFDWASARQPNCQHHLFPLLLRRQTQSWSSNGAPQRSLWPWHCSSACSREMERDGW